MKLPVAACALSAYVFASFAYADDEPATTAALSADDAAPALLAKEDAGEVAHKKKKKSHNETKADDATSADVRAHKRFNLEVGGGNVIGGINGYSVQAHYLLTKDFLLGASYQAGSATLDASDADFDAPAKLSGSMILARARYFIGNTFHVGFGAGERLIHVDGTITSKTTPDSLAITVDTSSIVVGAVVGNTWTFDSGLTLGCEWVGYFQPVSSSTSTSVTATGSVSADIDQIEAELQNDSKKLGTVGSAQIVAAIGFMF